jgi:hypothetical protein
MIGDSVSGRGPGPSLRRAWVLLLALLLAGLVQAAPSTKKGIGLTDKNAGTRIAALNVAWYYTWGPEPIEGVGGVEFVPMLWGGHNLDGKVRILKRGPKPKYLLLINEPDKTEQSNMSVDEVARLWPTLSVLGEYVSSPAAASARGPWAQRFHTIALQRGLKRDFTAIHVYGPPNPARFLEKVDEVHRLYGLPLWITEFAVADNEATDNAPGHVTPAETLAFMKAVLPELERRDYVQRYAWFGAGKGGKARVRNSRLFEADGTLNELGRYYAAFGTGTR